MANANHAGVALRDYGDATDLIGPQRTAADFVLLLKQQPSEAAARFRTVAWTLVRLDAQSHTPDLSPPVRDELAASIVIRGALYRNSRPVLGLAVS